ncbi:MAG: hypothetical protein ABIA62_00185 [Candidatus Woesearchaeota archaeon]
MPEIGKEEIEQLLAKYKGELSVQLTPDNEEVQSIGVIRTREYKEFKDEYLEKHISLYEKVCNQAEKLFKIAPDPKKAAALQESINVCHINITPAGAYTLSLMAPMIFIFIGGFISYVLTQGGMFFPIFFLALGGMMIIPFGKIPHFLADSWRMKASNQMVLSIFYIVTYMRHTSNLELAIDFAAEHLSPPLSLDFKRIVWNVETELYPSIKESLDAYLDSWRKWNMEFIEAMHLIEGSLLEGDENARVSMLDKSLDVILQETYEKMLHYAHNLKAPMTMLNMLGVILPILGLVILPLVVSFMEGVSWYHISALYNVLLPASVYYLGKQILAKRPSGYGSVDVSKNPELRKFRNFIINIGGQELVIDPIYVSIFVFFSCLFIAFLPITIHLLNPGWDVVMATDGEIIVTHDYTIEEIEREKYSLIGYKLASDETKGYIGPFGLGASLLSVFMPLSIGLSVGIYYRTRTKNVMSVRDRTKQLEAEFASALFQLGNRMGDGLPAEIAFQKIALAIPDTYSGQFFGLVAMNITKLGMNVEQAIFDSNNGAINQYPSDLIETSMKVLVESAKKGPLVAAQALLNVSRYIKQMHSVDERLKDLMSEAISSMKSQVKFLTPVISSIVIGITSMVTSILGKLGGQLKNLSTEGEGAGASGAGLTELFGDGMPTFNFQIAVGFYVVQIVYILTVLANGIENGCDQLAEDYEVGVNMKRSTIMYCAIAFAVMFGFNMIAGSIMGTS